MIAARDGHATIVDVFLRNARALNEAIDAKDSAGRTALTHAEESCAEELSPAKRTNFADIVQKPSNVQRGAVP